METEEMVSQAIELVHEKRRIKKQSREKEEDSRTAVMRYLAHAKGEVNPTDLCHALNVSMPRITVILNEMEDDGLITREISRQDRRRINISLTAGGKEAIAAGRSRQEEKMRRLIEKLGPEDAEAYLRILRAEAELEIEDRQ